MHSFRTLISAAALSVALAAPAAAAADPAAVVKTYADVAEAMYSDSLAGAKDLKTAIDAFLAGPTEETLKAARDAWKAARVSYQQTEGYRFGNAIVDEWEGRVNAWPLDEGLIDYVDTASYGDSSDENPLYAANVIANTKVRVGKDEIDASTITVDVIKSLQEAGGVEANVAIGYHAIEFLLWGQDLNGTGPGAGDRKATDFDTANCTNGNCDRRRDYLKAAAELLIADLEEIVAAWHEGGDARKDVTGKSADEGLATILTGLGSLSYGELAGERIKLGLILHDPEEEHDCFSDNTHNSHYYDQVGMMAIYNGKYGSTAGVSLAAYAAEKAPDEAKAVEAAMQKTEEAMKVMKDRADSGKEAYDQMIGEGNAEGNRIVQDVVDALVAQTRAIEALVAKLGLEITVEGSDSLDNPSAVQ